MKKKVVLSIFIGLYVLGLIAAVVILTVGSKKKEQTIENSVLNSFKSLTGIEENKSDKVIGIITIDAPISFTSQNPSVFMPDVKGAAYWLTQMNYAVTNEKIKAVVIRVNTPGGTVGASQELHSAVARIRKAGKPVITSVADLSASGGYYATVGSDRIFANGGSLIGSIGVIIGGLDFSRLMFTLGIKYEAITSGKNKDMLSPYKTLTDDQKKFLQKMVINTYNQFLLAVAEGRKKSVAMIKPLADGSVYTGEQALKNGLIDEIGTFHDAVEYTKREYALTNAAVEAIAPRHKTFNLVEFLSVSFNRTPKLNLIETTSYGPAPILYLYEF